MEDHSPPPLVNIEEGLIAATSDQVQATTSEVLEHPVIDENLLIDVRNLCAAEPNQENECESMNLLQLIEHAKSLGMTNVWHRDIDVFMISFASAATYLKLMRRWLVYYIDGLKNKRGDVYELVLAFIISLLDAKLPNGDKHYQPTSVRSFAAILSCWFLYVGLGDIKKKCPLIEHRIKTAEKEQVTVKAKTFSNSEFRKFIIIVQYILKLKNN